MVVNPPDSSSETPIYVIQLRNEAGEITDYVFATELARFSAASLALQPELGETVMRLNRELEANRPQHLAFFSAPPNPDFDWFRTLTTRYLGPISDD